MNFADVVNCQHKVKSFVRAIVFADPNIFQIQVGCSGEFYGSRKEGRYQLVNNIYWFIF